MCVCVSLIPRPLENETNTHTYTQRTSIHKHMACTYMYTHMYLQPCINTQDVQTNTHTKSPERKACQRPSLAPSQQPSPL